MGKRFCNFKILIVISLCMFCLEGVAQQRVVRRQPTSPKVTTKQKREKPRRKEKAVETYQEAQQLEMPSIFDGYMLQSAPFGYNCQKEDVRKEDVETVGGQKLHSFSVVVGNFMNRNNAIGMYLDLLKRGYYPSIAYSSTSTFYRVVLGTTDNLRDAIYWKERFIGVYPASWLLYKE